MFVSVSLLMHIGNYNLWKLFIRAGQPYNIMINKPSLWFLEMARNWANDKQLHEVGRAA